MSAADHRREGHGRPRPDALLRRGGPQGPSGSTCTRDKIAAIWGRMQVELLDRRRWRTRIALANAIFEYLEIFHNRQRRHSALGWRTPVEFEKLNATDVA